MKTQTALSALAAFALSTFALPAAQADTYTVNTSSDSVVANACANHTANCSLRGAILAANAHSGDTIVFNIQEFCPVTGCAINLLSALPDISAAMTIVDSRFTIQRGSSATTNFRIFNVTTTGTVNFISLTIASGVSTGSGAGIQNVNSGTVNVTNCTLRDNSAFNPGGGIFNSATGTLNVSNSTFSSNRASSGGAIASNGPLTVTGSTFSANNVIGHTGAHTGDIGGGWVRRRY